MFGYQETTLGSDQELLHHKLQILLWSGKDYFYSPQDHCTCKAQHTLCVTVFALSAQIHGLVLQSHKLKHFFWCVLNGRDKKQHSHSCFSTLSFLFRSFCLHLSLFRLSLHSAIFPLPLKSLYHSHSLPTLLCIPSLSFSQWLTLLPSNCLSTRIMLYLVCV